MLEKALRFQSFPEAHLAFGSLFHFAGGEAGGANANAFYSSVDLGSDILEIRLKSATSLARDFRTRPALGLGGAAPGILNSESCSLAACLAFVSHVDFLPDRQTRLSLFNDFAAQIPQ